MTSTAHSISTSSALIACAVNDLGFMSEQSLVLICTAGVRRRLVLVTRIDLPTTAGELDVS